MIHSLTRIVIHLFLIEFFFSWLRKLDSPNDITTCELRPTIKLKVDLTNCQLTLKWETWNILSRVKMGQAAWCTVQPNPFHNTYSLINCCSWFFLTYFHKSSLFLCHTFFFFKYSSCLSFHFCWLWGTAPPPKHSSFQFNKVSFEHSSNDVLCEAIS